MMDLFDALYEETRFYRTKNTRKKAKKKFWDEMDLYSEYKYKDVPMKIKNKVVWNAIKARCRTYTIFRHLKRDYIGQKTHVKFIPTDLVLIERLKSLIDRRF